MNNKKEFFWSIGSIVIMETKAQVPSFISAGKLRLFLLVEGAL
jgi:hypothetical protein